MLLKRRLKIHERCKILRKQIETYAWDEKAAKLGIEKPLKIEDHSCFVAGTLIQTPSGPTPIESLKPGDYVITPLGKAKIIGVEIRENSPVVEWNNTEVTPEHPVITGDGLVRVDALRYTNTICKWSQWYSTVLSLEGTQILRELLIGIILGQVQAIRMLKKVMCFALISASRVPGVNQVWTMFPDFARYVARHLYVTSTPQYAPVAGSVGGLNTVYSLKTEHGCYFANDILVSNCDSLRYPIYTKISKYRLAS
jgi:hypothetical protein